MNITPLVYMQGLPTYASFHLNSHNSVSQSCLPTCFCRRPPCSLPISDSIQTVLCLYKPFYISTCKNPSRPQQSSLCKALSDPASKCEFQSSSILLNVWDTVTETKLMFFFIQLIIILYICHFKVNISDQFFLYYA